MLAFRVYWREPDGSWHETEYASLTEAFARKAALKRSGIHAGSPPGLVAVRLKENAW